ncbi:MAG: hypothetical protein MHM6MM_004098 [Cercozoa sp. M6MM]
MVETGERKWRSALLIFIVVSVLTVLVGNGFSVVVRPSEESVLLSARISGYSGVPLHCDNIARRCLNETYAKEMKVPLDYVVTWGGPNAEWLSMMRSHFAGQQTDLSQSPENVGLKRMYDNGELELNLRLLPHTMPFLRRVFVVVGWMFLKPGLLNSLATVDGLPLVASLAEWLLWCGGTRQDFDDELRSPRAEMKVHMDRRKCASVRFVLVDASDIALDTKSRLHSPLFNSDAIEWRMAHIPGLSRFYVYANDDMFAVRPVMPSQLVRFNKVPSFFTRSKYDNVRHFAPPVEIEGHRYLVSTVRHDHPSFPAFAPQLDGSKPMPKEHWQAAIMNAQRLTHERFGAHTFNGKRMPISLHAPFVVDKHTHLRLLEDEVFGRAIRAFWTDQFRSENGRGVQFSLTHHIVRRMIDHDAGIPDVLSILHEPRIAAELEGIGSVSDPLSVFACFNAGRYDGINTRQQFREFVFLKTQASAVSQIETATCDSVPYFSTCFSR